jgi:AcrR family transcriptional regulator
MGSIEMATAVSRVGRPRGFDEEAALEAAMRVFWEKGYEGASLADLTEAMGINRPSLYAAFGDKETLFRRAIERYAAGPADYVRKALEESTARGVVEALLKGAVKLMADPKNPRGCLSVQGALACGDDAVGVKEAMVEWRKAGQVRIERRLRRAAEEGDLRKDVDPADLARYIAAVLMGLGVQAASEASEAEMMGVVEMTLRALPV